MNTYISQLMQQTGIALPSKTSWQGGGSLSGIFSGESGGEEVPLLEENREVIVPQPVQPAPVMVQPLPEETGNNQPRTEIPMVGRPRVQETVPPMPEVPPVVQPQARGERAIPTDPESTPPPEPQTTPELTIIEQVEIQSSTANISPTTLTPKEARPNLELPRKVVQSATAADIPPEKVENVQIEQTKTEPSAEAMPTSQTYLQVVRDWVAGTPEVLEEVREVVVEQPPQPTTPFRQEDVKKPIILKNQPTSPLELEQISHSETRQPGVQQQDFVLSIGSINLTLAGPPPQSNPPPIVPSQTAPAPDTEPFRLSRHYLRFR